MEQLDIEIKPNIAQVWEFVKKPAITLRKPYDYPTLYKYKNFWDLDGPRSFFDQVTNLAVEIRLSMQ